MALPLPIEINYMGSIVQYCEWAEDSLSKTLYPKNLRNVFKDEYLNVFVDHRHQGIFDLEKKDVPELYLAGLALDVINQQSLSRGRLAKLSTVPHPLLTDVKSALDKGVDPRLNSMHHVSEEEKLVMSAVSRFIPTVMDKYIWKQKNGGSVTVVNDEGEVRSVSSTGGEKGVKPQRYDLIPVGPLRTLAELYGKGAEKYEAHNWRKGYELSKSYAAMQRHANQFWQGQDNDEEMGLSHLASVIFHAMAMMELLETHPEFDDRYKKEVSE